VEVIEDVSKSLWDQVANDCAYATFFHTFEWASFFAGTYPNRYRIGTKAFRFDADDWMILPLMETGSDLKGLFKQYYSNIPGVYGGFISNKGLDRRKISAAMAYLENPRISTITVFGNPFVENVGFGASWIKRPEFTHCIDLKKFRNEEDLKRSYYRTTRQEINKCERAQFSVSRVQSIEEVRDYYGIYLQALDRWGKAATSKYDLSLFENIFKSKSDGINFWLIKKDSKIVGGSLVFSQGKYCVEWHCAYLQEYFKLGVRKYLTHYMIADALWRGFHVYDFNPSGGHSGSAQFKEDFGAQKRAFDCYQRDHNIFKLYRKVKRLIPAI